MKKALPQGALRILWKQLRTEDRKCDCLFSVTTFRHSQGCTIDGDQPTRKCVVVGCKQARCCSIIVDETFCLEAEHPKAVAITKEGRLKAAKISKLERWESPIQLRKGGPPMCNQNAVESAASHSDEDSDAKNLQLPEH